MKFSKRRLAKNRLFEMAARSWINEHLILTEQKICLKYDSVDFLNKDIFTDEFTTTNQIEEASRKLLEIYKSYNLCRYDIEILDAIARDYSQSRRRKMKKKILCIGQNKSASTSLSFMFANRGYSVCTNSHWMIDYAINGIDSKLIRNYSFLSDGEPINIPIFRLIATHLAFDAYFLTPIRPLRKWLVSKWNHIQRDKTNSNGVCNSYSSPNNHEYDVVSWIVQREINCRRFLLMKAMCPEIDLYMFHIDDIDSIVRNNIPCDKSLNIKYYLQNLFPQIFLDSYRNKTNSFSNELEYVNEPDEINKLFTKYKLESYKDSIMLPGSVFSELYKIYQSKSLHAVERRATFSL